MRPESNIEPIGTTTRRYPRILAYPKRCDMTTAKTTEVLGGFRFPDPPERKPDDMTSFEHLTRTGSVHHLIRHLGNPETTLVAGERYVSLRTTWNMAGVKCLDLLIAFDVDPVTYHRRNAYVISEQGKPPDFVLEIASRSTGSEDTGEKRDVYAAMGIPEYWRFDETGEFHGVHLAGDRLVNGVYEPIQIDQLSEGTYQGHSEVLDLNIRWHDGQLEWYNPETGLHIPTFDDERARADEERAGRLEAEARVHELEEELRRLRGS